MQSPNERRHVVVIGGGAAGMSCASTLANHPDRFKVTLLEKEEVVGGQATSISVDEKTHGASWINNGVQGGSSIFKHTFNFFEKYGTPPKEVQLQVSFGKGKSGFWSNCFPSQLVNHFAADIKKFGTFLKVIKWTLPALGIAPISLMLKIFMFSKDFGDKMVYPLIALFLGTGNQTPHVPSAIVERLFNDPNMKLWDYDPDTLLPNLPTMYTFGNLREFYSKWRQDLISRGVDIRNGTEVCEVLHRSQDHVIIRTKDRHGEKKDETFTHMVLCTLADEALRILGSNASRRERFVLGGARFYDDITVTHSDSDYFDNHYETKFDPDLCGKPKSDAQKQQIDNSAQNFRPMYFTLSYEQDPKLIEMSFNCSNYQHQFRDRPENAVPIYQSIFLNNNQRKLWTIDKISKDKIIKENWWHQLGHKWQHYVRVVPAMRFLQGKQNTFFAGSWTLVNMHEVACVSGIAAAYHLGADYEYFDKFASDFFSKYLMLSHGIIFSREEKKRQREARSD